MELTQDSRKSIANAENINKTIIQQLKEKDKQEKKEGKKKGVDLIGLSKKLAKRKIAKQKEEDNKK